MNAKDQNMPIALIDASPALRKAINKKTSIQLKLTELEGERDALQVKISQDSENRRNAAHIMNEAELIISGSGKPRDFTPRIEELHGEIRTLRLALELQEREVGAVRSEEGARLGLLYQPVYREHCKRIATILQELAPVLEAENEYRRAVIDADYPVHTLGEIFNISWLGHPGDNHSHINRLLQDARKHGYLA